MAYKHILIAVDLSRRVKCWLIKQYPWRIPYNAKVSLIHVDVNYLPTSTPV